MYIGHTIQKNPKMRWYDHCARTRNGQVHHLYNSMRKYGVDNFAWEIIDSATTLEELNNKEEYWLNHFKKFTECYNIREAGGNKTHSPESIERMRAAQTLRHATKQVGGWKRKDGGPMKGKAHPGKGRPHTKRWTEEMKLAHSIRCKEREEKKRLLAKEN